MELDPGGQCKDGALILQQSLKKNTLCVSEKSENVKMN